MKLIRQVVDLGPNFKDAKIGLIVPDYVSANSIADLEAQKGVFGGRITGIDAGAGVMAKTEQAIKAYGLDYTRAPSSGAAMTAELARAERAHKPIVVTGWIPHWMFAKWKLKFLQDPKKIYGASGHVDSMVNPNLQTKARPVYEFLKNFQWHPGEINAVMLATQEGAKPDVAAQQWITAHPDRVKNWLSGVK